MRRGVGALLVAFLAVRIFLGPVGAPSAPPAPTQRGKALQPAQGASQANHGKGDSHKGSGSQDQNNACDTKCLGSPGQGLADTVNESLATPSAKTDLSNQWHVTCANAKNAHFLIATVPDPVHTHLSLLFDRQIVAIEEAVQQAHYLFSRAYLPWDNEQHTENPDFHVRIEERNYVDFTEKYPGVLIFHNVEQPSEPNPGPKPLLVFLVGETPTGGINKDQFNNAIESIKEICSEAKGCAEPQPTGPSGQLFILGSTFSGSLYSLHSLLKDLKQAGQFSAVTIHSGTASSASTIRWFVGERADIGADLAAFRTFQESSDYAVEHLLSFVCSQGYRADRVAVLSEDETAYGNVRTGATASPSDDEAVSKEEICPNDEIAKVLHLYFPRDISQLRNAYAQDTNATAGSLSAPPRTTLQLNLADTGNDDDSVNVFAHGQTPLSQEATMMGIVSDLREHEVNLVVLEATNALDIVFLVRYLRVAYPDARLITINTDLLLPRQVNDPRLRGVMQVTSYPLLPEIDEYTTVSACDQGMHLNRIFPSDYSVGTFNAMLALMALQGSSLDGCTERAETGATIGAASRLGQPLDLPPAAYAEYGWPTLAGRATREKTVLVPPLWLTILGRDRFWPVELLDGTEVKTPEGETPSLLHSVASEKYDAGHFRPFVPAPWIIVCTVAAAFGLLHALLALNGSIRSASVFVANFALVDSPWRNRTLLFAGLTIFEVFLFLVWPFSQSDGHTKWVALIFALVAVPIACDLWRRGRWRIVVPLLLLTGMSYLIMRWALTAAPIHCKGSCDIATCTSGLEYLLLSHFFSCLSPSSGHVGKVFQAVRHGT